MGRPKSTRIDEGRKGSNVLVIKMKGINAINSGEGGQESLLCDAGSKLRLGGKEKEGEDAKWMENKTKQAL